MPRPWQDTAAVLTHFGPTRRRAVAAYEAFVAAGLPQGRRLELQGGGLVRSHGGWAAVTATRRTGALGQADARILGTGAFVAAILREAPEPTAGGRPFRVPLETVAARLAASLGVAVPALFGGTHTTRPSPPANSSPTCGWRSSSPAGERPRAPSARRGGTSPWRPGAGRSTRPAGARRSPPGVGEVGRPHGQCYVVCPVVLRWADYTNNATSRSLTEVGGLHE